jgi:hypothetical protein
MDPAVSTGIFTIAGGIVTYGLTRISQRRRAERQRANDLLTQVVRSIGSIQIEKAAFAELRSSWRPNWLRGAARGSDAMTLSYSGEEALFADRFQPAVLEVTTALVQRSLMSPGLQNAAGQVGKVLGAVVGAGNKPDAAAGEKQVNEGIASFGAAVIELSARKRWRRSRRPAQSASSSTALARPQRS